MQTKRLSFQQFTEIAAKEVYYALNKKYDVRNAILREIMPQKSSQIAVILVTANTGIPFQEPCIKKLSQAYLEYDVIYNKDIKAFAKAFAEEVEKFYSYVSPATKS